MGNATDPSNSFGDMRPCPPHLVEPDGERAAMVKTILAAIRK